MVKDDLIAELQLQLDEVVVEGQSFHDQMELYKAKAEQLEEEVTNLLIANRRHLDSTAISKCLELRIAVVINVADFTAYILIYAYCLIGPKQLC